MNHIHHVHIFASDIHKSVRFYEDMFGGEVILDMEVAGARNVFMKIGNGRIHFYDQPPKHPVRGSIHHFGIQTDDIEAIVNKLKANGIALKKDIIYTANVREREKDRFRNTEVKSFTDTSQSQVAKDIHK